MMTNRTIEMLKDIYNAMADKTISRWCAVEETQWLEFIVLWTKLWWWVVEFWQPWVPEVKWSHLQDFLKNVTVKGHPVMIGDVLKYIEDNYDNNSTRCGLCKSEILSEDGVQYCSNEDCEWNDFEDYQFEPKWMLCIERFSADKNSESKPLWINKSKPIDNQSEECIEYVHSLIKRLSNE